MISSVYVKTKKAPAWGVGSLRCRCRENLCHLRLSGDGEAQREDGGEQGKQSKPRRHVMDDVKDDNGNHWKQASNDGRKGLADSFNYFVVVVNRVAKV